MIKEIKLFNLDKKANAITWYISYDTESNWYNMSSGRVDGAITTTEKSYCVAKNIGRANATTAEQQCELEVLSRVEKQRKRGFQESVPTSKQFEVTLAKEFQARKKFIKFPLLLSAKLDGFRCYITKDGMFSRTHHQILSCPHIFQELKFLFLHYPTLVLDGELYSHELKDDFNKVASLISRTKNIDESFLKNTANNIQYHIFDTFFTDKRTESYSTRLNDLHYSDTENIFNEPFRPKIKSEKKAVLVSVILTEVKSCYIVKQTLVNSFKEIEDYLNEAMKDGYEGVMLRNPNMLYEEGRSSNLIKYKRFQDSEYKVIDIQDGIGNHYGQASIIICETLNGTQFSAGTGKGWDEAAKRDLFLNKEKYIGKNATIVYQDLTPDEQVPRFGKLKAFRN